MHGCLAMIVAFVFLLILVGIAKMAGASNVAAIVIAFLVCLGLAIYGYSSQGSEAERKRQAREKTRSQIAAEGFTPTHEYVTEGGNQFIAVDEERLLVRMGGREPSSESIVARTIDVGAILGVRVTEDGRGIVGSDLANSLGMAAVGGLMFGGAGAVVGAIAGQSAKTVSEVSVVISVDDIKTPYVGVNFLERETNRNSGTHRAALKDAQQWLGTVSVLISRRDRQANEALPRQSSTST